MLNREQLFCLAQESEDYADSHRSEAASQQSWDYELSRLSMQVADALEQRAEYIKARLRG